MYCAKFQKQISSFINNNLDINEMDMFINHARKCRDCYEELEINYMVNIGLEKIEKDESASFDLKGELEKWLTITRISLTCFTSIICIKV